MLKSAVPPITAPTVPPPDAVSPGRGVTVTENWRGSDWLPARSLTRSSPTNVPAWLKVCVTFCPFAIGVPSLKSQVAPPGSTPDGVVALGSSEVAESKLTVWPRSTVNRSWVAIATGLAVSRMIESVATGPALPRISPVKMVKQGDGQGAETVRAPSPNTTPTVLTPSFAVSVVFPDEAKLPAHPLVSGVTPGRMRNVHGKLPSLSTSTAYWSTPLALPGMPPISGSLAARLSVTSRLLV